MSEQTPPSPNPPNPNNKPAPSGIPTLYAAIMGLLLAITSALSGMKGSEILNPPTPGPNPTPVIDQTVIDDLINDIKKKTTPVDPVPKVIPKTDPIKVDPVQPLDPVACITVLDSSGQPLIGDAIPGQQLIISSSKSVHGKEATSLIWTVRPAMQQTATSDGTLILTTPINATTIEIQQSVAINSKIAQASVTIKSGKSAQPPPTPIPDVKPDPTPIPATVKNVTIAIINDSDTTTVQEALVLNNFAAWSKFGEQGNTWRLYPPNTKEPLGIAEIQELQKAGYPNGGIVIRDKDKGTVLYCGKLTSIEDIQSNVNRLTGKT